MVNKTAAFATLLTLGGAANGGMAQESMAQEGQVPGSENNQIFAETRTDTDSSPLCEQTADSALEPQCYYNILSLTVMENAVQEVGSVTEWPGRHIHCFR